MLHGMEQLFHQSAIKVQMLHIEYRAMTGNQSLIAEAFFRSARVRNQDMERESNFRSIG